MKSGLWQRQLNCDLNMKEQFQRKVGKWEMRWRKSFAWLFSDNRIGMKERKTEAMHMNKGWARDMELCPAQRFWFQRPGRDEFSDPQLSDSEIHGKYLRKLNTNILTCIGLKAEIQQPLLNQQGTVCSPYNPSTQYNFETIPRLIWKNKRVAFSDKIGLSWK